MRVRATDDSPDGDQITTVDAGRLVGVPLGAGGQQGPTGAARTRPAVAGGLAVLPDRHRRRRRRAATSPRRAIRPASWRTCSTTRTIAIAERPGNRRADGYQNVLANPHVGLLFLIPGRGDTLRINGRARLVADAPFFDEMIVKGHRPILALVVEIEEIFHHCAKAFLRSQLWQPETWEDPVPPGR